MIRVIVADDHPLTMEGLKALLAREADISILGEYSDGESALRGIEEHKPQVALLDIRMPGLDGVEVAKRVTQMRLKTACLMLTSYDAKPYVAASLKAGAKGYVLKSSPPEVICEAIRTVAGGRLFLDLEASDLVASGPVEDLSQREREVLLLASKGLSSKEIASKLIISDRTVQAHLASVYQKLGARNKTEALLLGLKHGFMTLDQLLSSGEGED
ncbi:MAG: response regulator transcription factor [Thermanaerothrix sp.]|nr:response regulator transcription factor [Thermanaerothrix sp.]